MHAASGVHSVHECRQAHGRHTWFDHEGNVDIIALFSDLIGSSEGIGIGCGL